MSDGWKDGGRRREGWAKGRKGEQRALRKDGGPGSGSGSRLGARLA